MVSLELLAAVAEAASALHRRQRAEALPALLPHADHVFTLVLHALNDPEGSSRSDTFVTWPNSVRLVSLVACQPLLHAGKGVQETAALACLSAWLRLDSSENSDALMSPGAFQSSQVPPVINHMCMLLTEPC